MKYLTMIGKQFMKIVLYCLLLCGSAKYLNYILVDDTMNTIGRIMMHEMYEMEENIDVLFLGSSHVIGGVVPSELDGLIGEHIFSAATPIQTLDGSYALLQEVAKEHNVREVYLDLYYDIANQGRYVERNDLVAIYMISDYMDFSFNKLDYIFSASSKEYYMNSFFPMKRTSDKIVNIVYMLELVEKKQEYHYKTFQYNDEFMQYKEKGYWEHYTQIGEGSFFHEFSYGGIPDTIFGEDYLKSLEDIINYCANNHIKLTLYSVPMSDFLVSSVGNYDSYIVQVNMLLETLEGIKYYDFNLCKEAFLDLKSTDFYDDDHLNHYGATKFSKVFGEFFTGGISEEELFYSTYQEKYDNLDDQFMGMIVTNQGMTYTIDPVMKGEWEITYEVELEMENTDHLVLEDQEVEIRMILLEDSNTFECPNGCSEIVIRALWNGEVVGSVEL